VGFNDLNFKTTEILEINIFYIAYAGFKFVIISESLERNRLDKQISDHRFSRNRIAHNWTLFDAQNTERLFSQN